MPRRKVEYGAQSIQKIQFAVMGNIAGRLPSALLENPIVQVQVITYASRSAQKHAQKHGVASAIYHEIYPEFRDVFPGQSGSKLRALVQACTMLALRLYKRGATEDEVRRSVEMKVYELMEALDIPPEFDVGRFLGRFMELFKKYVATPQVA